MGVNEEEGRIDTPAHTQPLQPGKREEISSESEWVEGVAEVELLPNFSKEERESNLTAACFMWGGTERKMEEKKTGYLFTQHPEIQYKY